MNSGYRSLNDNTLYAFYDLNVSHTSFDFLSFLTYAETARRRRNFAALHIVVVPPDREIRPVLFFSEDHESWRIHNLLVPACRFVSSIRQYTICLSKDQAREILLEAGDRIHPQDYSVDAPVPPHSEGWNVLEGHLGEDVQYMRATPQALDYVRQWMAAHSGGRKTVAFTLRASRRNSEANSDNAAWSRFAEYLKSEGCFPLLVPDIDGVFDATPLEFEGIPAFPTAAVNLELRMALYELAHICTFVSTGPSSLGFYNREIRYLYFATGEWLTAKPNPFNRTGQEFGRTPPFANEFQRWCWCGQDADKIIEAYRDLDAYIEENGDRVESGRFGAPLEENREPLEAVAERIYRWLVRAGKPHPGILKLILGYLEDLNLEDCGDPKLLKMAGDTHFKLGRWNEAARYFQSVIEQTDQEDAYVSLGKVYEASEQVQESIDLYERAIESGKSSVGLRYRMAVASQMIGDYDKSITYYLSVIDSGLVVKEVFNQLGAVYEKTGETELALKCYLAAMSE